MATYTVTHFCGHTQKHYIERFERDDRIKWLEGTLCKECYRAEQLADAKKFAAKNNLPELVGTEKQIAWAETIRKEVLNGISEGILLFVSIENLAEKIIASGEAKQGRKLTAEEIAKSQPLVDAQTAIRKAIDDVRAMTNASWWIDNKGGILWSRIANIPNLESIAALVIANVK